MRGNISDIDALDISVAGGIVKIVFTVTLNDLKNIKIN